jgi:hypothetical protein
MTYDEFVKKLEVLDIPLTEQEWNALVALFDEVMENKK